MPCVYARANTWPNYSPIASCSNSASYGQCFGDECGAPGFEPYTAIRATTPPPEVYWSTADHCGQVPRQPVGACCFEYANPKGTGLLWDDPNDPAMVKRTGCLHIGRTECEEGVLRVPNCVYVGGDNPHYACCYFAISFHEAYSGIRTNLDYFTGIPLTSDRIRPSRYHGDDVLCKGFPSATSPAEGVSPEYYALGFRRFLKWSNDPDPDWGDQCGIIPPNDDLTCHVEGMPLVIDPDGYASFYAGHLKTRYGCVHVMADLVVDPQGFARSVSCGDTNPDDGVMGSIAIGDLWPDECAAMYADMRYDDGFDCGN